MPAPTNTIRIVPVVHYSASDLLHAVEKDMRLREREANVVLPHALKTRKAERGSNVYTSAELVPFWDAYSVVDDRHCDSCTISSAKSADTPITPRQFWISLWTFQTTSRVPVLDLVLSCTASAVDDLPIFIYSNHPSSTLSPHFLAPRLAVLAEKLGSLIPVTRVFSIFASSLITKEFAKAWYKETGVVTEEKAYYEAALTFVTSETLQPPIPRPASGLVQLPYTLRVATPADLDDVAEQCKIFADDSETFPLSKRGARVEATTYINAKQVYVCEVEDPESGVRELASVVAVTRNTERSATITKVHTSAHHRRRGYAEVLVRAVCACLLGGPIQSVALYVAHDNIAAATVYDKVGFQGLLGKPRPEGVEDWLELGFVGSVKGFW